MKDFLQTLQIDKKNSGAYNGEWIKKPGGEEIVSYNPTNGEPIASVTSVAEKDYETIIHKAAETFKTWSMIPAPKRGEIVRQLGLEFRKYKRELGALVSLEMGKIRAEGEGEVQEMIDIADFAVGLSRQLYGLTIHSERPHHRMYEQWHPLGVIGIITAFNFPVAVWAWNAMIAAVCGDTMVWKPSSKTPITAVAIQKIVDKVMKTNGLEGIFNLCIGGGKSLGEWMLHDRRLPLISATGSCRMGRRIAIVVGERLGRCLLELGGNNAIIVMKSANLELATRAILFGAVGTSGQRCTSLRRLIVHEDIHDELMNRLIKAYKQIKIGDPLDKNILMGPLVDEDAVKTMMEAMEKIKDEGGKVLYGGNRLKEGIYNKGSFVEPTIVQAHKNMKIIQEETFAPILYILKIRTLEEAIDVHNDVPQGLSSAIFTENLIEAETFLSPMGSDCGIANANIGTSGAEIGGAFGGEKDTGGGRESGSDSWKSYMRRQTCTINWGKELPLAQGITFGD
ncbi:MAG: aldehyde dehydrogenase [Candidatus Schekmanbacteria bacterium RBG_13_48_7]|uniref:aldehyde dehydrogenase (NAD(+)) n=1 Tax=Candidatus Schekmanbacteria bacterium RBG_13_48_7 TaxID=1817878 RepID=A0A1F7RWE4_9BACT|nr:MAG: aldehyde dehydrogenase [Candidatus Schekmanbacteria bacterium RBG_13_48_7]